MRAPTAVLGLGNPIMTDEGIGVVLVQRLAEQGDAYPDVEFIDAGTSGMKLLHLLEGRAKAILIDCAYMDESPGTMRRFAYDDVESVKDLPDLSLHEGDLLQLLRLAKQLGTCPSEVIIFGIQPQELAPGHALTETLGVKLDRYCQEIWAELGPTAQP
ncbi:hydrogenase maturation protease [Planctomycetota bacterium]